MTLRRRRTPPPPFPAGSLGEAFGSTRVTRDALANGDTRVVVYALRNGQARRALVDEASGVRW